MSIARGRKPSISTIGFAGWRSSLSISLFLSRAALKSSVIASSLSISVTLETAFCGRVRPRAGSLLVYKMFPRPPLGIRLYRFLVLSQLSNKSSHS